MVDFRLKVRAVTLIVSEKGKTPIFVVSNGRTSARDKEVDIYFQNVSHTKGHDTVICPSIGLDGNSNLGRVEDVTVLPI